MDPVLQLEDINLAFGDHQVIEGLSLSFPRKRSTAVIGSSGSGKSLVLKIAAGLITPDHGRVFFEGQSISGMGESEYQSMQARTGFMFQDAALWANKTLWENLSLPLISSSPDIHEEDLAQVIRSAFTSVGLRVDPQVRPASISQGQRKMVSYLRATITEPEILFLDEPSTFMDQGSLRQLLSRIVEFHNKDTTLIFSTHNQRVLDRLAEDVVVLDEGRVIAQGDYREVMATTDEDIRRVLRNLTEGEDNEIGHHEIQIPPR